MKKCTYCGKEYPDEVSVCAIDREALRDVTPPVARASTMMTAPNMAHGRLSLGSFIKLSVIAAIGCLPILAVLYGLAFIVGLARGHHSTDSSNMPIFAWWPLLLLKVITSAVSVVASGFLAGLCGYPFYAWLCRRPGGIVLKGKIEVL